jgi:DNA-binding CsgD family transcriptional regulator
MTGAGLSDLVAKAFEVAGDTDGMTEFLAGTAGFFCAQQGAIMIAPRHNLSACLPITFGISPDLIHAWCSTRNDPDSIFSKLTRLRPGDAVLENGSDHDPHHPSMHLLGGVASADERNRCALVLWREASRSPFSEPEGETLRALLGYLRRAIDVNSRFINIFAEHHNAVSVLDQAPRAVIILGQNGQPTYQNLEAIRVLNKNDGVTATETGITIDDDDTQTKIMTFLEQIRTPQTDQFNTHRLITIIPRKSGGAPYKLIMYALPLQKSQAILNEGQGLAALLINDPDTLVDLNTSLLHNFYNLTRAETALAQSMFLGNSLPEASNLLGVSVNTTRTQLRSIFKKVGVHSQAALLQEFAKTVIQT